MADAYAQPKPAAAPIPIQAELIKIVDVRRIQAGNSVFARVVEDWNGTACTLRRGAIIEAKVETAQPRAKAKNSELVLSFSKAQCSGDEMAPIDLTLAAVSWSPDNDTTLRGQYPLVKRMVGAGGVSVGSGDFKAASNHQTLASSGMDFRASDLFVPRAALRAGDVYGIGAVKLKMGAGSGGSSLLYAKSRDVVLLQYTRLLLLPTSVAFVPAPVSAAPVARSKVFPTVVSAPPAPKEFEPCLPPVCTVDLAAVEKAHANEPSKSIAIGPLGYAPRMNREVTQLDNEEALTWIWNDQILVAFNPHTLVQRNGLSTIDAPVRKIHAVVLDVGLNRVLRTADWELSDSGKFLWRLSGNQVLVHAGNELRIYDSELELSARFSLAGPLGFVRISPNGEMMAVGIIRERHSTELHRKLVEGLDHSPEEDVEVLVLDRKFATIAESRTTSDLMPPTLLNEGQLTLFGQPDRQYRLSLVTWENQAKTLAHFTSSCTPELSSLESDLVFIRSCEKATGRPEFRALRADGRVVWRGQPGPEEVGHEAQGNESSRTFAVKMMHSTAMVRPGAVFRGVDLLDEEVRVYRSSDGKKISTFHAPDPAASFGGYSLSPDGSRLAMLSGGRISIFPIPAN